MGTPRIGSREGWLRETPLISPWGATAGSGSSSIHPAGHPWSPLPLCCPPANIPTQGKAGRTHGPRGPGRGSGTGPRPVTAFAPGHEEAENVLGRIAGHCGSSAPTVATGDLTASRARSGPEDMAPTPPPRGRAAASSWPPTRLPAPPSSLCLTVSGPGLSGLALCPCKRLH